MPNGTGIREYSGYEYPKFPSTTPQEAFSGIDLAIQRILAGAEKGRAAQLKRQMTEAQIDWYKARAEQARQPRPVRPPAGAQDRKIRDLQARVNGLVGEKGLLLPNDPRKLEIDKEIGVLNAKLNRLMGITMPPPPVSMEAPKKEAIGVRAGRFFLPQRFGIEEAIMGPRPEKLPPPPTAAPSAFLQVPGIPSRQPPTPEISEPPDEVSTIVDLLREQGISEDLLKTLEIEILQEMAGGKTMEDIKTEIFGSLSP